MTWGKRRFSNRSTPDNARFVRRAPVGYFRIFTALHRSCSQLHVALLAARHITASGLLRLLRLGMEHELDELLDLAGRSFECRHEILCLLLQLFVFPFPYVYIAFERLNFILQTPDQPARSDALLGKLLEKLRVLRRHGDISGNGLFPNAVDFVEGSCRSLLLPDFLVVFFKRLLPPVNLILNRFQPRLLLLHLELRYRQVFLRAAAFAALHIVIPGVAHIPEEIVLQNAIGLLENRLAFCA